MDSGSISIDRRSPDWPYVVFMPGWAHDSRTMSLCPANVNRIYVSDSATPDLLPQLADYLVQSSLGVVSIVGWSMGGYAALDFAKAYPEFVRSLVLVGIRQSYSADEIEVTRRELMQDKTACLESFYRRNFLPAQRRDWSAFKAELLASYIIDMGTDDLMQGLDYLVAAGIDEKSLTIKPTLIVHGKQDVIASADDALKLAHEAGAQSNVIEGASHAAFLHADFARILEQWLI